MSYEQFKKLKYQETNSSAPENPYVKKVVKKGYVLPEIKTDDLGDFDLKDNEKEKVLFQTSLLNGQNKYLFSELKQAQREIKDLKEDIASLYLMIINENSSKQFTAQEAREKYMEFKTNEKHLINRKNG